MLFRSQRIALIAGQSYRGEVRGLCGTFDGEEATDFTAPRNCILKNAQQFAATWAISPSGAVKEQQQKAQNAPCYAQRVLYGDVVSDAEAGRYQARHSRSSGKQSSNQNNPSCTSHKVKVVEQNGQICFSLRPLPACNAHCQPNLKVEKIIEFHCVAESSASRHWADMIKKGANPDFSKKGPNQNLKVTIPAGCNRA